MVLTAERLREYFTNVMAIQLVLNSTDSQPALYVVAIGFYLNTLGATLTPLTLS